MKLKNLLGKSQVEMLPLRVSKSLESQFGVDEQVLARLRCMEKSGRFVGRQVSMIRVYDPSLLRQGASLRKFDDLTNHSEAIMFEGHIEKDGYVYLRSKNADGKSASVVSPRRTSGAESKTKIEAGRRRS